MRGPLWEEKGRNYTGAGPRGIGYPRAAAVHSEGGARLGIIGPSPGGLLS